MDSIIAGALFDFVGCLSTHKPDFKVGGSEEFYPLMEFTRVWAKEHGLDVESPDFGWQEHLPRGDDLTNEAVGRKVCELVSLLTDAMEGRR